jgi:hypothetical protein
MRSVRFVCLFVILGSAMLLAQLNTTLSVRGARRFPLVELSGLQTSHNKHEGRTA